jgi:hypothetical protein
MSRLRISAISIALICANQAPWAQNSQIETWTPPSPGQERHPGGQYRWSPKGNQQTSNASGQTQSPSAITDGSGGTGADAPVQVQFSGAGKQGGVDAQLRGPGMQGSVETQFSGAGKQGGVDAQLTGPGVIRMWASTPSPTFGFWSGGGQEEASYGSRGAASSVEGGAGGQGFP